MTHTPKDCGCIGEICYWHKELDKNIGILQDNYAALKKNHAELLMYSRKVMRALDEHGSSILPHLLDSDENDGQRLREAIYAAEALEVNS